MSNAREVRVTYLITTRNRAAHLERTLVNVREFITPDDELIIIDGLSTDYTRRVVEQNSDIVTVFVSEKDTGEAHALNKGLFRASGRYIKLITDDDYFYPDAMRELISQMEANPTVDAILCGGEIWRMQGEEPVFEKYLFLPSDLDATPENLYDHAQIGLGLIIRRSVLEKTGGVSSNYTLVDGDLFVRLLECRCGIGYLDVNLYKWYLHPHSGSHKGDAIFRDQALFAVRMGKWERALCHPPETLGKALGFSDKRRGRSFVHGIWMAGVISNTIFRSSLPLLGKLVSGLIIIKGVVTSFTPGRKEQPNAGPGGRIWSGSLRSNGR